MTIGKISADGTVVQYKTTSFNPSSGFISATLGIILGKDGNIWFCETQANSDGIQGVSHIGCLTENGQVKLYNLPEATAGYAATGITCSSNGNLWFCVGNLFGAVSLTKAFVGRITVDGDINIYEVPSTTMIPLLICEHSDGNFYFTDISSNTIHYIGKVSFPTGLYR